MSASCADQATTLHDPIRSTHHLCLGPPAAPWPSSAAVIPRAVAAAAAGGMSSAVGVGAPGLDAAEVVYEPVVVAPDVVGRLAAADRRRHALPEAGRVAAVRGQRALEPLVLGIAPRHVHDLISTSKLSRYAS